MRNGSGGWFDKAISLVLSVAALGIAVAVVYREFFSKRGRQGGNGVLEGSFVPSWKALSRIARPVGDTGAPIEVIEFIDLECSACRNFYEVGLPDLKRLLRSPFKLSLVHLPLSIHRFAKPAARAAECAAEQGQFGLFVEGVMTKQDSIGLKSWESFAGEAKVADLRRFAECNARPGIPALVDSGMAAARRLGITGTPTIIVNGWRIGTPSPTEIARVINELNANRAPYPIKTAGILR